MSGNWLRPELQGTFGMVASTHWLASAAGMSVLERGGNAFDAAAATGFVLQVVEPHENGPGGEMVALVHHAGRDETRVVCGQGPAPAAATIGWFRDQGLDAIPYDGLATACVPGAVGGWLLLLREYGSLPLRAVLEPAIGYADHGFPLVDRVSLSVGNVERVFREHWPESARVWLAGGGVPAPGTRFRLPGQAAAYRRLLTEAEAAGGDREAQLEAAHRAWYEGFVAEAIDRFLAREVVADTTGRMLPGLLRGDDLARWRPALDEPMRLGHGEWLVCKPPVWSQGPAQLQHLSLLGRLGIDRLAPTDPEFLHLVIECAKLAYADREAWYGDPAFVPDVTDELLSDPYTDRRAALVGASASRELRPGAIGGRSPELPYGTAAPAAAGGHRGDTCHLDVVDRWGNMVAATPSGGWLEGSPVVPGLGFCLTTRLQLGNLRPGHPNALAPRKRPRTTLSPNLAVRSDGMRLAYGCPGADEQDQWSLNLFLAYAAGGRSLQEAIELPVFHTDHFPESLHPHRAHPGRLVIEDTAGSELVDELRRRGHRVVVLRGRGRGRLSAVAWDPGAGLVRGAASARAARGYAVGR